MDARFSDTDAGETELDGPLTMPAHERSTRVVLADDDCVFREDLRQLLSAPRSVIAEVYGIDPGCAFQVVFDGDAADATVGAALALKAELLLVSLGTKDVSFLQSLRAEPADAGPKIILLSDTLERPDLLEALVADVRGVVLKSAAAEVLFTAIACVMAGRYWMDQGLATGLMELAREAIRSSSAAPQTPSPRLTRREREILELLVAGYGNKEIAQTMGTSADTIKHHLTRMFAKCGVSNRVELATAAVSAACYPR